MSRLLEKTLSSNYLAYCSMLQTIDQSLEEKKNYYLKIIFIKKKLLNFLLLKNY